MPSAFGSRGGRHLAPRAVARILVLAPADELRAVAEAVALHLVVPHLGYEALAQARLLELPRPPPVRLREAPVERLVDERQHARRDVVAHLRADRARADVVEAAVLAVETEQQRRDRRAVALPADADHCAVRRSMLLDLDDGVARARQVRRRETLPDHAVEAERFELRHPRPGVADVARRRRDPEPRQRLDPLTPLLQRQLPHRLAFPDQDVEDDVVGRDLRRKLPDPRLGRMEPRLHRVEVERTVSRDHDLAVQRRVRRQQVAERPQLREIAQERPFLPRPERQLAAGVLEHSPKAVPFRLVLPAVALGQLPDELRLHRREGNVCDRHRAEA